MQDRKAARLMKPLATHGRTIHWVNNGCAGRLPDTSAAPQLADDFVRLRKSAEVGQEETFLRGKAIALEEYLTCAELDRLCPVA